MMLDTMEFARKRTARANARREYERLRQLRAEMDRVHQDAHERIHAETNRRRHAEQERDDAIKWKERVVGFCGADVKPNFDVELRYTISGLELASMSADARADVIHKIVTRNMREIFEYIDGKSGRQGHSPAARPASS